MKTETANISPPAKPAPTPIVDPATPAKARPLKLRAPLKRRSLWLIGALLLAAAGAFGYHWAFGKAKVHYTTAAVERGDVESTVVAAGIVQPTNYVDVGAQTSGKLKSLKVNRGDLVEANQLLAEIDPVLADTALTAANAALESMTAQGSLKQAQLVLAKLQEGRNDELLADLLISTSDRDITRANYDVAFADAASLSAQMKQAAAAIDTAKANLGYTKITAPMAGEVVSISLLEGQTLNANQQAPNILRIADISTVTVWAQVSEADIVRVKPSQEVYFTILGDSRRWNGKIRQILPTPELINNVVFYDVLFDIPNPERELRIQMTAQVFIVLAQAKSVLLIPVAAIGNASEGAETKVQVLKPDGTVELRAIKLGIKSEMSAEVKDGLKEKEQVVIATLTAKGNTTSALSARKGP
ncbi:macrolide transporter subunit, membrane fusion protein (MFP) component [Verrucomicrobia bacterium]|nr:macrolide transporter subunit, membrane fusion protein (MFP) component [Verrucomicrobiota bacterium]